MSSLKSINPQFIYNLQFSYNETASCLIGSSCKAVTISSSDNYNRPSIRDAIDLITNEIFSQNFLKAGRAFVINVCCRGSLLPLDPQQLKMLENNYKDRPMIFFFESKDSGFLVYYKDNSDLKFATNISTISIKEFNDLVFSFELLLSAMWSKFGGNFPGSFKDLQLNVMSLPFECDEYRLIDIAVLDNNQLCIRFLQLFENCVENVDNYSIKLLQNAARMCNFDSMLAIFDLNFDQKETVLKINRDLLNIKDSSAFNLLMISVESGNVSATIFWLNLRFFDVNYEVNSTKAADLACKLKDNKSEILLMLLQNDSKYPKNYVKMEKSVELRMFSNKINEIHEAIKLRDIKKAKEVLYNLKLRYYFDEFNKSAAYAALENREFDIYKLLMMNNSLAGSHEDLMLLNLEEESKITVKMIHDKYKSPLYEKCVLDVEKKIKCLNILEIHRQKYQFEVRNSLNLLFDVETFQPILQIVASSDVDFILDFERDAVNYLDPLESPSTRGYFTKSSIYIACKNLLSTDSKNLFLSTLIHEMTHFVIDFLYDNSCLPFVAGDNKRAEEFHKIYENCKKNSSKEKIIESVYGYHECLRYSELIVRPNHLTAHYIDNEEMQKECEKNFFELFKFYRERIYGDMLNRLEWLDDQEYVEKHEVSKKRKLTKLYKDTNFDVEGQKLLENEGNLEMSKFSKFKFFRANWKKFSVILVIFLITLGIFMAKFSPNQLNDHPHALKVISLKCTNVTHPWYDLISTQNLTEIENIIEIIKNSKSNRLKMFNELWRINDTCNPITLAIEAHPDNLEFTKDLIDVAKESFSDCEGRFNRLLANCIKFLRDYCDENNNTNNNNEFREILDFMKRKLNKLVNLNDHRSYVDENYEKIGEKCS